ncbi:hypothetical protein DL95DRAFT_405043 [Leptodontidium sp. 2 PMI_412]|nr:hypothetical protein DL95DRAFT_405043 [Leptodontidium sp. 2 PMI_412]
MTFAWASENWNRDREENQLEKLRAESATKPSETSSLKDWLDTRACQVSSLPRGITPNQNHEVGTNTRESTSESRDLKEWLSSREQKAVIMRGAAINLASAFARPTFVPDPSTPPFTPRSASHSIRSNSKTQEAANAVSPEIWNQTATKSMIIRVTSGQVFLALSRLVLEVNWDFFHQNRLLFDMSDTTPERSEQWWNHICQVYYQYCKAASQGAEALMELYKRIKERDQILDIEQTVLNPILRFLVGYKAGYEGEKRGKDAVQALLTEGDFLVYVLKWCQENGLTYLGGTGRTKERLK